MQDVRFDNHLTGVKKESLAHENNSTQQRVSEKVKTNSHVERVYLVKTKSAVSFSSLM